MRLYKCYFCSSTIYPGHGQTFVRNDCKIFRFCRHKCKANFNLKRNPRKVAWTKAYRKARGKEMKIDRVFDFERKRMCPQVYDRELVQTTVKAMQRVSEIKSQREQRFYDRRMKLAAKKQYATKTALREIKQGIDLVAAPQSKLRQKVLMNLSDIVLNALEVERPTADVDMKSAQNTDVNMKSLAAEKKKAKRTLKKKETYKRRVSKKKQAKLNSSSGSTKPKSILKKNKRNTPMDESLV